MSELREYRYLCLPVILALLAAMNIYWYLSDLSSYDNVVVATHSISPGMLITSGNVTTTRVHSSGLHPQSFATAGEVIGRISLAAVVPGEQLLSSKTTADPSYRGLSAEVGAGWRGVYVPAGSQRGLVGALVAGERVDVLHVDSDWRGDTGETMTIANDALVLDVRDERGNRFSGGPESLPSGVVLLVSTYEATLITQSQSTGNLFLTIAPAGRR